MLSLLTHSEGDINALGSQETLPFEVVLDSGAVEHVADDGLARLDPHATAVLDSSAGGLLQLCDVHEDLYWRPALCDARTECHRRGTAPMRTLCGRIGTGASAFT